MKRIMILLLMFSFLAILSGCGDTTTSSDGTISDDSVVVDTDYTVPTDDNTTSGVEEISTDSSGDLKIIGKITYDRVHVNDNGIGLNYNNITVEPAKQVVVEAIDRDGKVLASTTADDNGEYELTNLPSYTDVKVRAYAKLYKEGDGGWDVKVVDNTNDGAQYVIEGSFVSTENVSTRRDIHASSGWGGSGYTSTRAAAPFAILGSIYQAMEKVKGVDSSATFPTLVINWSPNNVPSSNGTLEGLKEGLIGTSHFDGTELYILGDANSDTDEYDDHVMIHEWAHYFEANFSRADSIGGPHTNGDILDIRVAFGEGWGNAWSAIATDNPIYFDTMGMYQANGFYMDIENQATQNPGWFSEVSIQKILYDLYDSNDDGSDKLSLGFKPIYDVLTGPQKTTPAFTSIFTFTTYLKDEEASKVNEIDELMASENIESIQDIYGSTIAPSLYVNLDDIDYVCTYNRYGVGNKLYDHRYIKFDIGQDNDYIIRVEQNNGTDSDPDFTVYNTSPFTMLGTSESTVRGVEENRFSLTSGNYLLDISDYNGIDVACFDVTIQ